MSDIREIAARAGVSTATVSRLLAGKSVRASSRARVQAVLERLDYRPNLAARRLRADTTRTVGFIAPDLTNPFFVQLARAVEDAAWRAGFRVILCNSDEDAEREARYLAMLREEKASGLIVAPTHALCSRGADLGFDVPAVLLDRAGRDAPQDAVLLDNERASSDLVRLLHARGHRTIAGLFSAGTSTGRERRDGYERALADLGLEPLSTFVPHGDGPRQAAVAALLDERGDLDAAVVSNGLILLELAGSLRERSRGAALAAFDGGPWLRLLGGDVLVVRQPVVEMAEAALGLLLDRIGGSHVPPQRRVFAGTVVAGTAAA